MYEFLPFTQSDVDIIGKQLKSETVCMAALIERCPHGYPSIILLKPHDPESGGDTDGKSLRMFANLVWLTCPYLNKKIHDLESNGYIGKISAFINRDKSLQAQMKDAHAEYHFLRKYVCRRYLDGADGKLSDDEAVVNTGIGGIRNLEHLKCLHLHYAHFRLCAKNIAGRIVCDLLEGVTACSEVDCKNVL
jgi:uncharacterized protein